MGRRHWLAGGGERGHKTVLQRCVHTRHIKVKHLGPLAVRVKLVSKRRCVKPVALEAGIADKVIIEHAAIF